MLKTRIAQGLMIVGAFGIMFGVSAFAGNPQPIQLAQYAVSPQPPMQNLGTVPQSDVGAPSSAMMAPTMNPAPAYSDSASVIQPVKIGDVTYVTGGIGDEERDAMKQAEKDYNLRIMSASKSGDFIGDTHIVITHAGQPVLDASSGPLFFVNLPAGKYAIEATCDGQTRKQNVSIGKSKPSYVHLSW